MTVGIIVFVMAELFVLAAFNPLALELRFRSWQPLDFEPMETEEGRARMREAERLAQIWSPRLVGIGTLVALGLALYAANAFPTRSRHPKTEIPRPIGAPSHTP